MTMPPPGMQPTTVPVTTVTTTPGKVVMETPEEKVVSTALDPHMKIKKNYERPKEDTKKAN